MDDRPAPPRPYGLMLVFGVIMGLVSGGLYVGQADPAIIGMTLGMCIAMVALSSFFLIRRGFGAAR